MTPRRRTASHQVSVALLNAAEAVLDRDGVDGVTIRAVAHHAEVSPMSVYNRFTNKEGLTVALAMRTLEQLAEAIDVPGDVEPVERFAKACRNYREFALRYPARYALIFGAGSPLEDQSSEVARAGHAVFAVLVELIRAMKSSASEQESAQDAQAVWSAVHGAVTIEQAGINQTPDAADTFEHMLDMFTRIIRCATPR
ncbi:TetR/AcrR family transcriptional regulator [Mycolicibacterium sp. 120270]|uniref:TetR/AcrR family transcriptional regulator n=1 Tax=Mycolicibacterium sp. 120270 TaxID=3090600 RepID=UPI00299E693A|nr:TetR/AcrR family transcriptional regulator [Mycolicibacterium sp. 120270]MDX1885153.1 TetR/AcrR family transcriptional regulator [Mycolicibacterium sp. 120270]